VSILASCLTPRQARALALGGAALPAWAAYPDKPIRMVVAFPPGGGPDLLARTLADGLRASKGWNIVVRNKPGAGGNPGTTEVANAPPDGYTVLFGHVGALAVTSDALSPDLPAVATVAEQDFLSFKATTWFGMVAPKGTPAAVVAELNGALQEALRWPALAEKYRTDGAPPVTSTPDAFVRFLRDETARWGKVVRDAGVEVQ
jgi:tripartite-type tricarboxylate transporter receptor subunit TctC